MPEPTPYRLHFDVFDRQRYRQIGCLRAGSRYNRGGSKQQALPIVILTLHFLRAHPKRVRNSTRRKWEIVIKCLGRSADGNVKNDKVEDLAGAVVAVAELHFGSGTLLRSFPRKRVRGHA